MSTQANGEITLALPASEFIDRYLISRLKLDKFRQAGKSGTQQLEKWLEYHQDDFAGIINHSGGIRQAAEDLARVHEQLWELEDRVRSPQAADIQYFADTARKIFSLNTDRHKLKHAIDIEMPSLSFGPRLYDKGAEQG